MDLPCVVRQLVVCETEQFPTSAVENRSPDGDNIMVYTHADQDLTHEVARQDARVLLNIFLFAEGNPMFADFF